MGGLCSVISSNRARAKQRTPMGIVDSADATHDGIKTVETRTCPCDCPIQSSDLTICIVTWNMNGSQASYEDMQKLIGKERNYDLLVIGLQEVPRNNIVELLENVLDESHLKLADAVMQSLQIYMFSSKTTTMHITDIKVDKQGVGGCGGLIRRKKGAVAIRITYKNIDLVFISCHLSAHGHNVEDRNSECRHISQTLFSKNPNPYAKPVQVTVWLGDLNYRLQGITTLPARSLIRRNLHKLLTSKDQLLQEAEKGQVFNGYCEGALSFKPTYKYDVGTSDYDTSYKVRAPAWTDRILYKVEDEGIQTSLHLYESVEAIHSSDHKPVKAHLCLKFNNK